MNGYDYFGVCDLTLPAAAPAPVPAPVAHKYPVPPGNYVYVDKKGHEFCVTVMANSVNVIKTARSAYTFTKFDGTDIIVEHWIKKMNYANGNASEYVRLRQHRRLR